MILSVKVTHHDLYVPVKKAPVQNSLCFLVLRLIYDKMYSTHLGMHKTTLVGTNGRGDKLSSSAVGVVGADVAYSQHTHTDMCWRPCTVRLDFLLREIS